MINLRLLKYHNVASGKYKTNFDIGLPSKLIFENEVKKYCYMWREGGQFSTEKYDLTSIKKLSRLSFFVNIFLHFIFIINFFLFTFGLVSI